jgi:hypothetical protein
MVVITTDEECIVIDPTQELLDLYEGWQRAERGSSRESQLWTKILDCAQELIAEDSESQVLDVWKDAAHV